MAAAKDGRQDRAFKIAFANAAMAAAVLSGASQASDAWPALGEKGEKGKPTGEEAGRDLAMFVRRNKAAPPEALYRHAYARGFHANEPGAWDDVPLAYRMAYGIFGMSLEYIDAQLAGEVERLERRDAERRDPARRAPEEKTLEEVDSLNERLELAQRKEEDAKAAASATPEGEQKDAEAAGRKIGAEDEERHRGTAGRRG